MLAHHHTRPGSHLIPFRFLLATILASSPFCLFSRGSESRLHLLRPVRREPNIAPGNHKSKDDELDEEPSPSTALAAARRAALALLRLLAPTLLGAYAGGWVRRIQVLGRDRDDVVVVGELARLGAEAEVRDGGDLDFWTQSEAVIPLGLVLVLQVEREGLVLEISQAELGGDIGVAKAARLSSLLILRLDKHIKKTYRAASQLIGLAVVLLVIDRVTIAEHGHDIGKHDTRPVVLVRVDEDAQAVKLVLEAKDLPALRALLGEPHGHAVAVQSSRASDLEFDLNLPYRISVHALLPMPSVAHCYLPPSS